MVDTSSNTGVNKAQLVATQDGRVIVPVYDWSTLLGQYFKKLPNIKKFHHFQFSKDKPGVVYCREFLSSLEKLFFSLRNGVAIPPASVLPQKINPEGLSEERQNYLYRKIRQFGSLERRLSCTSSMISELYQLFDVFVDVTFHDSIAQCKRIRIITAVIEYIHQSYLLR